MRNRRKRTYLFREMSIVDKMQEELSKNPDSEKMKQYRKMQDLFFKHVKEYTR